MYALRKVASFLHVDFHSTWGSRHEPEERRIIRSADMPEATFKALQRSEMDPRHAHLDALMNDD